MNGWHNLVAAWAKKLFYSVGCCRVFAKMGLDRGLFLNTVLLRIKNGGSSEESCDAHHKCEKSRRIRQRALLQL